MVRLSYPLIVSFLLLAACGAPSAPAAGTTSIAPAPDAPTAPATAPTQPVTLRLLVSLDAATLADYEPAIKALDQQHPEWTIALEQVPQQDRLTRLNTLIAAGTLPDVILSDGTSAQQFIRQGAFEDLGPFMQQDSVRATDFYTEPMAQFAFDGKQFGLPAVAAPEIVFYNKQLFDAAGQPYPADDWTFDDMRAAARKLTLDKQGHTAGDPDFDPNSIVQWGWNNSPGYIWTNHMVQPFGANYCANADCTQLQMTDPRVIEAIQWWADMVQQDKSTLYDPYGGSQTGVPGDPFIAGKAAMGFNGFFAVGQLNQQTQIDYDILQPFKGRDGKRFSVLSVQGYQMAATSLHKPEAWALIQALTDGQHLASVWGKPGHFIPARRSAARSILNPAQRPKNQQALLDTLEYAQIQKPYTASAFEVYGKTAELFVDALKGEKPVATALQEINTTANEILKRDRTP